MGASHGPVGSRSTATAPGFAKKKIACSRLLAFARRARLEESMKDFRDRVVVITGAGSGIGRAAARAFARLGARIHAVDIDSARAERTAETCLEDGARAARAHRVDCSDRNE